MTAPRSVGSVSVSVVPDATGWKTKIEAELLPSAKVFGEKFGKAMGEEIARQLGERTKDAPVGPSEPTSRERGTRAAATFADAFKAKIKAAMASLPPIEIDADSSEADKKLHEIRTDLAALSGKKIGVDLTDEEAVAKLDELRARLTEVRASSASLSVRADTGAALAQLDKLRANIDELTAVDREVDVDVKVHDEQLAEVPAKVAAVDASAGSSGGGFSIFGGKIAAIGGLAVAAADIAIPAVLAIGAAAAGALAGIAVLGLGFSGIGAALQAHDNKPSGGGGGGSAGAGLGLESARINAAQATRSAQDQLTNAIQSQAKAEKGLHDARVQALQDLQDLDNKLKDNTLSQVQAAINLNIARRTLAVTLNAPGASQTQYADQVAQARLNVQLAQQKVSELALAGTRLAPADALAHKQGITGNPNVVAAQQTLTDANRKLAEAQANIGITAQKNAIALQQAAISMAGAAGGANQFANAMAKLNPIQQQFVEFLISMKPLLDQLKLAASGFLPGLEQGLKSLAPVFGQILTIVSNIAGALGKAFQAVFAEFSTPEGRKFLTFLSTELPYQIQFLASLFIDFGRILAAIWEAAAPLIHAFDDALLGALDSMAKAAKGGGLKAFFDALIPLIKPTFQFLSAFGHLVVAVLTAIAPALPPLLNLLTQLANAITDLVSGPVGQLLVQTFIDLVNAVSPLIPLLAQIIEAVLPPLLSLIDTLIKSGIGPLVAAIAKALQPVLPPLATALTGLVTALAPFIVQLIQSIIPILPQVASLLIGILNAVIPLIPQFGKFLLALTPLIKPLTDMTNSMLQLVQQLLPYVGPLIGPITEALKLMTPVIQVLAGQFKFFADQLQRVVDLLPHLPHGAVVTGHGSIGVPTTTIGATTTSSINGKASGGPVMAGHLYRVGEIGPELFVPRVDGSIINAADTAKWHKSAGNGRGGSNYFTVYGQSDPVATSHAVANRFAARAT